MDLMKVSSKRNRKVEKEEKIVHFVLCFTFDHKFQFTFLPTFHSYKSLLHFQRPKFQKLILNDDNFKLLDFDDDLHKN